MFRLDLLQDQDIQNILLVSRVESKLNRKLCKETDLSASMDKLVNQGMILNVSLRIQGEILLGIVRIYNKKVELFIDDATVVLKNLQKALKKALQCTPDAVDAKDQRNITITDVLNDDNIFLEDLPANFLFGDLSTDDEMQDDVRNGPLILDSQRRRENRQSQEELDGRLWEMENELPSQEQIDQAERECEQLRRSLAGEGPEDIIRAEAASPGASLDAGLRGSLNEQQNTSSRSKDNNEVQQPDLDLIPDDAMEIDDQQYQIQHQEEDQQNMDVDMGGAGDLLPDIPQQSGDAEEYQQDQQQEGQEEIEQQIENPHDDVVPDEQQPPEQDEQQQQQEQQNEQPQGQVGAQEDQQQQQQEQQQQQQEDDDEEYEQVGREHVGRKRRALFDLDTQINRAEYRQLLQDRNPLIRPRQRLMTKKDRNPDRYGDAEFIAEIQTINQNQAPALRNLYERIINPALHQQLQRQRQQHFEQQENIENQQNIDENQQNINDNPENIDIDEQVQNAEQQLQENIEQQQNDEDQLQENNVDGDVDPFFDVQMDHENIMEDQQQEQQQYFEDQEQLNNEFNGMWMDVENGEQIQEEEVVAHGGLQEEDQVMPEEDEFVPQPVQDDAGGSSSNMRSDSLGVQFSGLGKQAQNGTDEVEQELQEVDPSTGFTKHTQIVHDNLKNVFSKQDGQQRSIGIYKLLQGRDKQTAARVFFETLALQNKGYIKLRQDSSDADIMLLPTEKIIGVNVGAGPSNLENVLPQEDVEA